MKKKLKEELVRKTLDLLIENAKTGEDLINIKIDIEDYIEEGYYIKAQIQNYNDKVRRFYAERN